MEVTTEAKAPQFDLLAATRRVFRKCPVPVKFRHVKGHQDDNFYADLDEWASLNIDMDDGAKEHWLRSKDARTRQQYIFGEPWPFWVAGRKVTKEVPEIIVDHIDGMTIREYWESKKRFGNGSIQEVHWGAVGKAMESAGRARRHWVVKQASGFCATGKMMQRWNQRKTAKCPRCAVAVEDELHVWMCKGEGVETVWEESIQKLGQWMLKQKTLPNLAAIICDRLSAWRNQAGPTVTVSPFLGLRGTVHAQDQVGWRALLEGCPVQGWAEVQQRYFEWINNRRSGERWLVALIQKL